MAAALVVILGICGAARAGVAQIFDIHEPESKAGELEIESRNSTNVGSVRDLRERVRDAHELFVSYGLTDFWKVELNGLVETPVAGDVRLSHVEFENIFVARAADKGGLGLGWFTSVAAATDAVTTNTVVFGPIVQWKREGFSALANPFFERTFGQNGEQGVALTYTWRLRYDVDKAFGLGLEGFGRVDNVGSLPPLAQQDHRVGASLYFRRDLGGREIELEVGAFAGLTVGSPDATVKVNLSVPLTRKVSIP